MKRSLFLIALIATIHVSASPAYRRHANEPDIVTQTILVTETTTQTAVADTSTDANAAATPVNDGSSRSHIHHHTNSLPFTSQAVGATVTRGQVSSTTSASSIGSGSINANLVPDFGQQAGLHPDGAGNCKADSGKTIPCQCPPGRDAFIAKLESFVNAGSFFGLLAAPFPTGNSNQDALTRIDTIISALQNFDGSSGKGCPSASAPNFAVVQCTLLKETGGVCNSPSAGG